jgi:hypothetical protein
MPTLEEFLKEKDSRGVKRETLTEEFLEEAIDDGLSPQDIDRLFRFDHNTTRHISDINRYCDIFNNKKILDMLSVTGMQKNIAQNILNSLRTLIEDDFNSTKTDKIKLTENLLFNDFILKNLIKLEPSTLNVVLLSLLSIDDDDNQCINAILNSIPNSSLRQNTTNRNLDTIISVLLTKIWGSLAENKEIIAREKIRALVLFFQKNTDNLVRVHLPQKTITTLIISIYYFSRHELQFVLSKLSNKSLHKFLTNELKNTLKEASTNVTTFLLEGQDELKYDELKEMIVAELNKPERDKEQEEGQDLEILEITDRDLDHFKLTLDFLNGNAHSRQCEKAIKALKDAYMGYNEVVKSTGVKSFKALQEAQEEVNNLVIKCQNLLNEKTDPKKSTFKKVITGIMNVFKATGDAAMYLQGEKMLAELRLAHPDRHMLKKAGDYLLKMLIQLTQFFLNTTVKMRAFMSNTKLYDEEPGYRDKVLGRTPKTP